MRDVSVANARIDASIRASPEPAPAIVGVRIFRVDNEVDRVALAKECARNAKNKFAIQLVYFERLSRLTVAPAPALPFPNEKAIQLAFYFHGEKQIRFEG